MSYVTNFLYPYARNEFLKGNINWDLEDRFYLMFLNAGVGTATVYSATGSSYYAYDPKREAASTWAGWAVSNLSHIPFNHRTINASFGGVAQYGGTAVTYALIGTATSIGNGVAEASNVTYYNVPTGAAVSAFVIYRRPAMTNGTIPGYASTTLQDQASELIAFFGDATGMPVNGNNGDITVQWDTTTATRIFRL